MTDPKPDHGERTYRGTGRLAGREAIITGADSGIGRAVAIAFAREGADVVLSYLPAEEPDAKEVVALGCRGAGAADAGPVTTTESPAPSRSTTTIGRRPTIRALEKRTGGVCTDQIRRSDPDREMSIRGER